ncbi:MAG: UvrD-helicase domain-containing protein [Planctomycetota bacterium]|jgi:DNA helicase-2/ATP-dependent DNA helicase PcrA|nr:UvrD-helicase domain-containing protein [Planctomycetota bacterium]
MEKLNTQQQQAVCHREGPLLILAGAGTGKTRVITERIARLLSQGVKPENILGVTFTNKAAAEMRSRLAGLLGKHVQLRNLILSTFHSLAVRLIRPHAGRIGFTSGFSICDAGEQLANIRKAAATVRGGAPLLPDKLLARISRLKNQGITPEALSRYAIDDDEHILAAVYRRYQEALRRQDAMDFDDLLLQAGRLLREYPDALDAWRNRFHYIMIDEFQDSSHIQFDLMRLLASPRDNLCVVGDDDQSIYAWRGAKAGNILKFQESYPRTASITLERNYRSTATILAAANAVIQNNVGRKDKNLWSELGRGGLIRLLACNDQFDEAERIVQAIRERRNSSCGRIRFADFAVIIRSNAQSRPLEDEFVAARLPFEVIGGQSLFDRKEARDVMAFLALAVNPEADSQLRRVINVPPRGIGDKTIDLLSARAIRDGSHFFHLLSKPELEPEMGKPQVEACRRFASEILSWGERLKKGGARGLVKEILNAVGYQEELRQLYRNPLESAARWNEALEMDASLSAFAAHNPLGRPEDILSAFLDEATLAGRPERGGRQSKRDAVSIITAHSAKGLEFPETFIAGLEEDTFPNQKAVEEGMVEEERRLFYVAMTRARLELTLTWNRARLVRGKERKCLPSRFLAEIPAEFIQSEAAPSRQEAALEWLAELRGKLASR